jgi:hypothetical protein
LAPVEPLRDVPADRPTQARMLETWNQTRRDRAATNTE